MRKMPWLVLALQLAGFVAAQTSTSAQHAREEPTNSLWWEDFDGDGREDAFVLAPNGRARLLRNRGGGTLENVTRQAGLEGLARVRFARWKDFDGDGRPDLFLGTGSGPSLLFENHGGTFVEVGAAAGLAHAGRDLHAEWSDYDRDGLVDLHVRTSEQSLLYRNLGEGLLQALDLGIAARSAAGPAQLIPPVETSGTAPGPAPGDSGSTSQGEEPERTAARETSGVDRNEAPVVVVEKGEVVEDGSSVSEAIAFVPPCLRSLRDMATGSCLMASSVPALGQLHPITQDLFVSSQTGFVGLGTTSPGVRLEVNGSILTNDQLVARDSTGSVGRIGETTPSPTNPSVPATHLVTFYNGAGHPTSSIGTEVFENGRAELYNELGQSRVAIELALKMFEDADGEETVRLDPRYNPLSPPRAALNLSDPNGRLRVAINGAPEVNFLVQGAGATIHMESGEVNVNSISAAVRLVNSSQGPFGQIIMTPPGIFGAFESIRILGHESLFMGGGIQMLCPSSSNLLTVDIRGGGLRFSEVDDGSTSCDFFGSVYDFRDSSGAPTISFDRVSGTKSAVVDTPNHGRRLFYAMESPEVWFEDLGSARLSEGSATIHLDPMFLESVTVSEEEPLKVFVTLNGESEGVFVEKGATSFTVRERNGGTSNVAFDYRVVAKRAGLEGRRLEPYADGIAAEEAILDPEPLSRVHAGRGEPSGTRPTPGRAAR